MSTLSKKREKMWKNLPEEEKKQGKGNQCQTPGVKFESPVVQFNFSFGDISV